MFTENIIVMKDINLYETGLYWIDSHLFDSPSVGYYDAKADYWNVIGYGQVIYTNEIKKVIGRCIYKPKAIKTLGELEAGRIRAKAYRDANKGAIRAYEREYRKKNSEKLKVYRNAYMKEYRAKHNK